MCTHYRGDWVENFRWRSDIRYKTISSNIIFSGTGYRTRPLNWTWLFQKIYKQGVHVRHWADSKRRWVL